MVINSLPYTPETCNHFTCRKEDRFKIGPPFLCKAAPLLHKFQTPPPFPPTGRYDFRPRNDGFRFPISAHIIFFGEDCIYTVVVQHYTQPQTNTGIFEKDDTPVEQYVHNGQTFYILSNLDSLTATTYDGEFMTMINGSLTREEIKAIIDSIPAPSSSLEPEQLRERLAQEGQSLYFPQIPEGFEPTQSQYYVDPITEELFWSQLYQRGEEFLIFGVTKHAGAPDNIYEKDDTPVEQYVYHQVSHYIFSNNGSTTAAWMVGDTEYYMFASDGAVDMKALNRSAYEAVYGKVLKKEEAKALIRQVRG